MKQMYYRDEYTETQWRALIGEAAVQGFVVTYGKYGDRAEIYVPAAEDGLLGEIIRGQLHKAANVREWVVKPKKPIQGQPVAVFYNHRAAEAEAERLERETGFEWFVTIEK